MSPEKKERKKKKGGLLPVKEEKENEMNGRDRLGKKREDA